MLRASLPAAVGNSGPSQGWLTALPSGLSLRVRALRFANHVVQAATPVALNAGSTAHPHPKRNGACMFYTYSRQLRLTKATSSAQQR